VLPVLGRPRWISPLIRKLLLLLSNDDDWTVPRRVEERDCRRQERWMYQPTVLGPWAVVVGAIVAGHLLFWIPPVAEHRFAVSAVQMARLRIRIPLRVL